MIDLFQSPPFAHVRQRNKISVKFFYPADCQTDRALLGQLCLADKRVIDFDFLPAELPPLFLVLGLLGQARLDYPMAVVNLLLWVDFSSGASRKKASLEW